MLILQWFQPPPSLVLEWFGPSNKTFVAVSSNRMTDIAVIVGPAGDRGDKGLTGDPGPSTDWASTNW